MRLPGAGRAVEQDATLEVLAVGDEALAVLTHPDDVVRDPVEHAVGQHDGGGVDRGPLDEGHAGHARAVGVRAEGHDLSADDAPLVHEHVHSGHQGVRDVAVLRDDLDGPGLPAELSVHALLADRDRTPSKVKSRMPDVTTCRWSSLPGPVGIRS